MPFTPEDGTGLADANAYIDIVFFDAYWGDRGVTVSAMSTEKKQSSIVRATDYIDKRFSLKFRGFRESKSQALEWPRLDAEDDSGYLLDDIPKQLAQATCEYALRVFNLPGGELAPDPALGFNTRDTTGVGSTESASNVQKIREKVGPLETETEFGSGSRASSSSQVGSSVVNPSVIPAYPAADLLLQELLTSSRDVVRA